MLEYYRFKQIADLFDNDRHEEARLQLAELQRRYIELCDENLTYKTQIQEYEDVLYLERNLFFDGELYWLITGSIKQGPFCTSCYNTDGLLVRLAGDSSERYCPHCHTNYATQTEYQEAAMGYGQHQAKSEQPMRQNLQVKRKILPFQR